MNNRASSAVVAAVTAGLTAVASDPGVALAQRAVPDAREAVLAELGPTLVNVTNNEPWYQSRVTIGALLAMAAGVLALFGIAFPDEIRGQVTDLILAAAPVFAGALALYGRWKARKPLGA